PVSGPGEFPVSLGTLEKNVIESGEVFGFKLLKQVNNEEMDKNLFISPLSVSMALGMTFNGAEWTTKEAMRSTLEFDGLTDIEINETYKKLMTALTGFDSRVTMQIANSIWHKDDYTFEEAFFNICRDYFNAEVRGEDFSDPATVDLINGWIDTHTNGKITEVIDEIEPLVVMYLINAIYFKGTWQYEFDEGETADAEFTKPGGDKVNCKMMHQENKFRYLSNDDFQAVDLPYGDGNFCMTVLLPKDGKDIDELIGEFSKDNWNRWLNDMAEKEGVVELPRFKMEYEITLNDVLKALGMGVAFGGGADFTKMYSPGGIFIDEVIHKTFVEVNEEGTEASAVTVVVMRETSTGGDDDDSFYFRADRPFVYVIHEKQSGTLLFIGKIVVPSEG
ncbi:serpin family protein, partial [candidate division KSB1 bacterium]